MRKIYSQAKFLGPYFPIFFAEYGDLKANTLKSPYSAGIRENQEPNNSRVDFFR